MSSLTFLGAAGTVTGSKHLLEVDGTRDPGRLRALSGAEGAAAAQLGAAAGRSRLDRRGRPDARAPRPLRVPAAAGRWRFRGRIFCTPGTKDLCSLVLPDAAHIQEEDAREANRHGYTKHKPALPLYTSVDAARALTALQPVGYDRPSRWGRRGSEGSDGRPRRSISSTPGTCSDRPTRACGPAGRRSSSAATSAATAAPCCRTRRRSPRRTSCCSSPPTATGCTSPTTTATRLADIVNETAQRGGKLIIPVVRHRPRRGSPLLAEAARGREADPGAAGVRRQPDGDRRVAVLRRPRSTSSMQISASRPARRNRPRGRPGPPVARTTRVAAFATTAGDGRLAAAVGGPRRVAPAVDRHRVERHGDRRARAAPPRRDAAQPEKHGALRRLPGGRHARPAARRRRQRDQAARTRRTRSPRASSASTRCRRTPTPARSCAGSRDSTRAAADDLPRARRPGRARRARRADRCRSAVAGPHRRAPRSASSFA